VNPALELLDGHESTAGGLTPRTRMNEAPSRREQNMSNHSRMLALVFGGALFVGISQSVTAAPSLVPADVPAPVSVESCDDAMAAEDDGYEVDAAYECSYGRPYCRRASQCEEYCAGGAPVCSQGCCACAS
jgi:hypothetical protein